MMCMVRYITKSKCIQYAGLEQYGVAEHASDELKTSTVDYT